MRIALVHSYYSSRQPSGENVVVDAQAAALADAGHDVLVVAQRTDRRERRRVYPLEAAWTVATGNGPDPSDELRTFAPNVVHVHNLFPNFGTRWLAAWQGPIVATLHNFRPMCAAGTLYRDGAICTLCPDGDPGAAVRHSCYRGSRLASVPVAVGARGGLLQNPLVHRADALVVLTDQARSLYRSYGVDDRRMRVVPNFVTDPYDGDVARRGEGNGRWLYVGRLTAEKGVVELLDVWPRDVRLDVFGAGPLAARVEAKAGANVRVRGEAKRADLRRAMPQYEGFVFSSRCFEGGYALTFIEALAAGLPVVALEGNAVAQTVRSAGVGVLVAPDAGRGTWAAAIASISATRPALSDRARQLYEDDFTPATWIRGITEIYETLDLPLRIVR